MIVLSFAVHVADFHCDCNEDACMTLKTLNRSIMPVDFAVHAQCMFVLHAAAVTSNRGPAVLATTCKCLAQ